MVHARNALATARARASSRSPRPGPGRAAEVADELGVRARATTSSSPRTTSTRSCSRPARSTTPSTRALCSRRGSISSSRSRARRRWPGRTPVRAAVGGTPGLRRPGRLPPPLRLPLGRGGAAGRGGRDRPAAPRRRGRARRADARAGGSGAGRRLPRRHGLARLRRRLLVPRPGAGRGVRGAAVVGVPGARGARRSRQRRGDAFASTAAARARCTSRGPARGATTCVSRSSATRARSSSATRCLARRRARDDARRRRDVPAGLPRALHRRLRRRAGGVRRRLRGEGPPGPGLEDDRRAVAIGVAARASAVAGSPLEVGPDWPWTIEQ